VATLVIRDLDPEVKARLRRRAAENGRSMEAEARAVLQEAVGSIRPPSGLGTFIHEEFAGPGGIELSLPERDSEARVADLT
jgi:plasmid stability protein